MLTDTAMKTDNSSDAMSQRDAGGHLAPPITQRQRITVLV